MGGINHQPCSHYLRWSTKLSRAVSLARAELDLANVALEDVLLKELDLHRKKSDEDEVVEHLRASSVSLLDAGRTIEDLRQEMKTAKYRDLPPIKELDLEEIGCRLEQAGVVDRLAWDKMGQTMRDQGFEENLDSFGRWLDLIAKQTNVLIMALKRLGNRSIMDVTEGNDANNFKIAFARLYTSWGKFHAEFLASSLVSTEVWYTYMGYGSLIEKPVPVTA